MKWISMLGLGLAGIALLGCGPEETAPSCPDPASGEVDEACGIWVSASLGRDGNPGTRELPMASLSAAVERAANWQLDVYACGELWTEPLILRRNVSLFGGFDCEHGWAYRGESTRARLETGPDQIPLKTDLYGGHMEIVDFDIRAADASVPGGSSIAVLIGDTNIITFRRCLIMARDAADGLDGEEIEEMAMAGAAGSPGAGACTTADGPGGAAVETTCAADAISRGGKGGDGGAMSATDGEAGLLAPDGEKDPSNLQDGDGGKGQAGVDACTPGEPGADGAKGAFGLGRKNELGLLTQDGFVGADGPDGEPGRPGQGGGGGGASRGGAAACGAATPGGAGGGSGGAGGCGGKGGKGGQAGGSSFAVVAFDLTELDILSSELWVGRAGDGGRGAPGQPGGAGGEPGKGGAGQGTAQAGCQGGKGGAGGKGGGGAGGNGGHAVHIARSDVAEWGDYTGTTFNGEKNGGLGGAGGDPDIKSDGADGQGNNGTYDSLLGFRQ